jgi:hypothetical protein
MLREAQAKTTRPSRSDLGCFACYNTLMFLVGFFEWWYGPGWRDAAQRLRTRLHDTYLGFSVPLLARTIFAPWRRITSAPGASLQDHMRAMVDNLVSRAVGSTVRIFTLIAALGIMAAYATIGGLLLVLWPVLPLLGPVLIVWGIVL